MNQDLKSPLLRSYFTDRLAALDRDRTGYWATWRDLAQQFAPRRGRFLVSANDSRRGRRKDQRIIDNTPLLAARVMASGMMAGISSPARPWFRLRLVDDGANDAPGARAWLDEVQKRMLHVFAKSNLYNCLHTLYGELGVFGTAGGSGWGSFSNATDSLGSRPPAHRGRSASSWGGNANVHCHAGVPVNDVSASQGTTPIIYSLSVPSGMVVYATFRGMILYGTNVSVAFYSPDQNAQSVGTQGTAPAPSLTVVVESGNASNSQQTIRTNAFSQIVAVGANAAISLYITTESWMDGRGRDT